MRGQKITPEIVERIKALYAETENIRQTARELRIPESTVRNHVKQDDEFAQVRAEKREALIGDIAEELAAVRQLYLDHLKQPEVIAAASAKDAAVIVGVFTDKHQLVTGEATERTEHTNADDARSRLAGRLDDLAARRAARADREPERGRG
jgi:predicted transcriptional regulator